MDVADRRGSGHFEFDVVELVDDSGTAVRQDFIDDQDHLKRLLHLGGVDLTVDGLSHLHVLNELVVVAIALLELVGESGRLRLGA